MGDKRRPTAPLWSPGTPAVDARRLPNHNRTALLDVRCNGLLDRACMEVAQMSWEERIVVDPGVRSGKPCIKGTRITVYDILEYMAGEMSEAEILADFPSLTVSDLKACLAFAAARERRLATPTA